MITTLKVEFKRAFCNKYFWMVVAFGCTLAGIAFFTTNAWGLSENWLKYMAGDETIIRMAKKWKIVDTPLEIWMPSTGASGAAYYLFITIAPVLAAIPYGGSFLQDKKSGLINQMMIRTKKQYYYVSKLVVAFISGGTVIVIPLIFNLVICMCFLPWGIPIRSTSLYIVTKNSLFANVFYSMPALYVLIYLLYTFFVFGLLNCLCLTFVYVEENKFAVLLTPFILYFASHVVVSFGLGKPFKSLLTCSNMFLFKTDAIPVIIIQLIVLIAGVGTYFIRLKKDVL